VGDVAHGRSPDGGQGLPSHAWTARVGGFPDRTRARTRSPATSNVAPAPPPGRVRTATPVARSQTCITDETDGVRLRVRPADRSRRPSGLKTILWTRLGDPVRTTR